MTSMAGISITSPRRRMPLRPETAPWGSRASGYGCPALLVSPLIDGGTVFRGSGPIDHTSVLKTISERWGTAPLTARDRAAGSLGDVISLAKPRTDDPLSGVVAPISSSAHPGASAPTKLDRIHAARVAALPIRNEKGHYPEDAPVPVFGSTSDLSDFIRDRTAGWKEHVQRQKRRRAANADNDGK